MHPDSTAAALTTASALTQAAFKQALGHHAGAVSVIAAGTEGQRTGLTATSVCSLSDSPPTILVCVNRQASAYEVIRKARCFSVNVLQEHHRELALRFAGRAGLAGEQRFAGGVWTTRRTGAPLLEGALVSLDCELLTETDAGTHSIFIGLVRDSIASPAGQPLINFRGSFAGVHAL